MDLDKMETTKQLNYRLNKRDKIQHEAVMDTFYDVKEDSPKLDITALDYLGMLWLALNADNVEYRPKTRAERTYVVMLEDYLDKHFSRSAHEINLGVRSGLYVEAIEMLKKTLIALHFSCLDGETKEKVNEKLKGRSLKDRGSLDE